MFRKKIELTAALKRVLHHISKHSMIHYFLCPFSPLKIVHQICKDCKGITTQSEQNAFLYAFKTE